MEYLFLYALQISEAIHCFVDVILIGSLVILLVMGFMKLIINNDPGCYQDEIKYPFKGNIIIIIISTLLLLTPTKQTLMAMGGLYFGKQVIKTEMAQKVKDIINLELDNTIKELKTKVTN